MRKSNMNSIKALGALMMVVASLLFSSEKASAQAAAYTNEGFNNIPGYPTWTAGASFKTPTVDWTQAKISGGGVAPNDFQWVNAGANPATANQNIVGLTAGAGFVRYVNRTVAYPALSGAPNGDAAFIATRSLDWSGHTTYNYMPNSDTIGISVYRDNTAAALAVADYIEVWVNTQPSLSGATLALTTGGDNKIHRSTNLAPVAAVGWNRYKFVIPNDPRFYDPNPLIGGTSSAYIIIAGYSAGGNNIFIDNINMPQWQTPMVVTAANVFITQSADVGKNSTDNLMLGVQVTTKGSLAPKKLDGILFNTQGSTAFTTDVTQPNGAKCWYTGGSTTFATTLGAISVPKVNPTGTPPTYTNAQLYFGFLDGVFGCPTGLTTTAFNFFPGGENFVWLAYDVPATAQAANFVAGGFEQLFTSWSTSGCFGDTVITSTGIQTPVNFAAFVPSPSVSAVRQIDQAYNIPTYSQGTSWPSGGYYNNDFISGVYFPGDNSTQIDNYYHDVVCGSCVGVGGQNCDRFSCHPPDYTQFKPVNMGQYKERVVKVTQGKGVRTGTAPYAAKAKCGTWFSANTVAIFIDWNKDGDFDDRYNGVGGFIYENYGSQQQSQASMTPGVWGANTSWAIDVPSPTDAVTDLNDPGQLPNNSVGPIIVGNVRMRVREIFAAANNYPFNGITATGVHPTNSGFTWGEVEDYTIQVLPDCPPLGSNVCKWVGATNDWNNPSNWCPALPTKNDIAYISPGPLFPPTILDSTNAECRTLQIEPGAKVVIDATKGSSLKVYDDVIIGRGATLSTGSSLAVTSDFIKTITIPGKSQVPPLGLALATVTPFRTNAQAKTQIAYTATELKTTYGWKAGDVIESISIEVNSISGGAGPSTYSGLRIMAYLRNAPVTYPFPAPPNTKIACMPGDLLNVATWPRIIFGPGSTTLNMPNAAGGTQANGNYYTFNLIPNTLIWDGVSNLVLSFENWTSVGLAPAKNYVLYDESSPSFSVLVLNNASVSAGPITGQSICGSGVYYNISNVVTLGAVTATVSNSRPRLDFKLNRPYQQFPITVGGDWINNNTETRGTIYSTTPVYGFVGDSGFIASNSRVIFDPTGRSGVNSPGLASANGTYYSGTPGATLASDVDQNITSELTITPNRTMFGVLEVNKSSATGKAVKQSSVVANLVGANSDSLVLTQGELNLNKKEFILRKPSPLALVRNGTTSVGWIRSEDVNGILDSKFTWKMGTDVGVHVIPWGDGIRYYPFTYQSVAGDQGDVKFATYHTATTNTTLPVAPILITKFNDYSIGGVLQTLPNAYDWTVDRYWYVNKAGSTGTASLKFGYDDLYEGTNTSSYLSTFMKATRNKNDTMWWNQQPGQSDVKIGNSVTVTTLALLTDSINGIWVITRTSPGQSPLPVDLIDFTAKLINKKVKLNWIVESERDVAQYNIERTVDNTNFEFVASREPVGPSTSLLNYEAWDNNPVNGLQYYRLATNFSDGTIDYSKLVPIRIGTTGTFAINSAIALDGSIKTNFTYDSQLPYNYMVVDIAGREVASEENLKAEVGSNEITFPVNLSKGVYTLMISNSETMISKKLIY